LSQPEGDGATHYDLILIGTGSGNSIIGPEMDAMRIAIVERDLFGGTCLNRGCIPSKMFVVAAEAARTAADSRRLGIYSHFDRADWPAIVERVFGRIDPIAEGGRVYRHSLDNVTVYEGDGRFSGERQVEVRGNDGQVSTITGDQVVIATGARAHLPEIAGLDEVAFHTSDTIMRLPALPGHLIVVGGGFIACEMADVFAAFGSKVTVIQRSDLLLRSEDHDIAQRFTELASERFDLRLNTTISRVESDHGVIRAITEHGEVLGDTLLIATGRQPNGDQLNGDAAAVAIDANGAVVVDEFGRTTAPGVWALGDVNGRYQLKHMANGEAKVIRHNVMHPNDLRPFDSRPAPHGVFAEPQIGAVGLTEAECAGRDVAVITHPYGDAAYGWALEDTAGFVKLIGDRATRTLIGAHVIGVHAATLVQLLIQGMHLGNTVDQLATGQIWIHPTLAEVVEQALLKLIDAFDS